MNVLFIVLNQVDTLEDVLTSLTQAGVRGATILDSQGMGSAIYEYDNQMSALFGSLKSQFDREHPYNKTIFTVIENETLLQKAMDAVEKIVDMNQPNQGMMFTVPVGKVVGLRKE
ncbi:MAG: P-II family nitrogen regulator [Erysipelothrix sp.]